MERTTPTLAAARIVRFLEQEPVVWLSTVRPDGSRWLGASAASPAAWIGRCPSARCRSRGEAGA